MAQAAAPPPPPPPPPPPVAPPAPPAPIAPVVAAAAPQAAEPPVVRPEKTTDEILAFIAEARAHALDTSDVSQANSATGVYGDSGTGKTSQMATAIEYCWETFHKISHFYAADLGGYGNKLIKLAKLGICRIYAPRNHVEPFETAELISMGYFPETIGDPITGYADPYVRLVPPQVRRWTVFCPEGHPFPPLTNRARVSGFQQQCPVCRKVTAVSNWLKVEEQIVTSPGFKHVGLRLYDSGTALQDWVMEDMASKAAKEEFGQGNQLKGTAGKIVSGEMVFGSNSMYHFGFAQNRMPSWIANSRRIPGNVVPPIWSFLEQRGKDEGNIVIFGPSIAGNAKTSDVPSWLGNCLHLAKMPDATGKMVNRIYLQNHSSVNEGNIPHLAKHRGDAGTMPEFLEDQKDEPPFTTCSLKYFFIKLEQALKTSLQAGVEQYADAPALVGLDGDDQEEIVSTTSVSMAASVYHSPSVAGQVAGAVPVGQVAAVGPVPMGVPPPPPVAGGVPPLAPPAMAAPVPQTVPATTAPAAGVPGPRPPVPQAAPPVAAPAAVVGSPAPGVPPATVPPPAAATTAQTASAAPGGAPVRPPVTTATAASASPVRANRPPVPPPPGQPQLQ